MNPYKAEFGGDMRAQTRQDALKAADLFLGLRGPNLLNPEWLRTTARDPVIFLGHHKGITIDDAREAMTNRTGFPG